MKFMMRGKKYLVGRNRRIVSLFAGYLGLIFVFATIYFVVHASRPGDFLFNADVLRAQSESFRLPLEREIERSDELLRALTALSQQLTLSSGESINVKEGQVVFDASTYRYVFYITGGIDGILPLELPFGSESALFLSIRNTEGSVIGTLESRSPAKLTDDVQQYQRITVEFTEQAELVLENQRRRMATLTSSYPEVWSYWDFFYFSTITQTTVGYGDILPNSTLVRMLVVVQVILGLIFIGVLINFVSPELKGSIRSSSDPLHSQAIVPSGDIEGRPLFNQAHVAKASSDTEAIRSDAAETGRFGETQPGSRNKDGLETPSVQTPARRLTKKRSRSRPHRRR